MALVLLSLGSIRFFIPLPGVDTPNYEVLARDSNYSWISAPRLSRSPALQFTGTGEESVTIEGRLYPNHFGGLSTIVALDQAGKAGQPMDLIRYYPLTDSEGYGGALVGKFVLRRLRRIDQHVGDNGLPHRLDFALELARYGEDAAQVTGSA